MRDDPVLAKPDLIPAGTTVPRVGWSVFVGSVAAMVVVFALVTVGVGAVANSYRDGALLGAFCAGWGGVGFGVMFSGALAVLKDDDDRHR